MFVSIDMDKLVFLHKHHDGDTLRGLSFLEAPDRSIMIENTLRVGWLGKLSRLDMCMLYKNTVGRDITHKWEEVQRTLIQKLVERMPATLALAEEVQAQVAHVEDDLHKGIAHKYALGARVPAQAQELFPLTAPPLDDAEADKIARQNPPPAPGTTAAPEPAPVVTVEPKHYATATRTGGVRQVVYAAADKAWEEAGKGTKATWEQVRAKLIEQLVAASYHPTTVRIKLSEWSKANAI